MKLLPSLRSLNMAYNPLKSEYVEGVDKSDYEKTLSKFTYTSEDDKSKQQQKGEGHVNDNNSEPMRKSNGPMSRIENINLSGIDTKRTNICILLSRLPMLKVIKRNCIFLSQPNKMRYFIIEF